MSYILEALKKSEKERQRGTLPDMLTVQDIVAERPGKRLLWAYLLAAILLLNAGVFVWWQGFSHTTKVNVVQTSKTDNIAPLSVNESAQAVPGRFKQSHDSVQSAGPALRPAERNTVPVIEDKETAPSVRNQHPPKVLQEVQAYPVSADNTKKPSEAVPAKSQQSTGTGRIPSDATGELSEMPDENKLYKLQELPSAIRQNLPVFSVSALLYSSNSDSRMVRVNEQMMHEGQDLTAGIKLEEITRDGLIFRYQKYRFFVGAK